MESTLENELDAKSIIQQRKICFIITPISDDNTEIRRHVDGLIDAIIIPELSSKYNVEVSHRITTPGSISKQMIINICEADLVIANLTRLNPNVMYELAIRHAIRKPVIMIMEKSDEKIPFDVVNERTIFYKNDFRGALDLRDSLKIMISNIDEQDVSNPIYDALQTYGTEKSIMKEVEKTNTEEDISILKLILRRLDKIESSRSSYVINGMEYAYIKITICKNGYSLDDAKFKEKFERELFKDIKGVYKIRNCELKGNDFIIQLDANDGGMEEEQLNGIVDSILMRLFEKEVLEGVLSFQVNIYPF